ncbi:hypothetical protein GH733_009249, partial [Mirounga leonina]
MGFPSHMGGLTMEWEEHVAGRLHGVGEGMKPRQHQFMKMVGMAVSLRMLITVVVTGAELWGTPRWHYNNLVLGSDFGRLHLTCGNKICSGAVSEQGDSMAGYLGRNIEVGIGPFVTAQMLNSRGVYSAHQPGFLLHLLGDQLQKAVSTQSLFSQLEKIERCWLFGENRASPFRQLKPHQETLTLVLHCFGQEEEEPSGKEFTVKSHRRIGFGVEVLPGGKDCWGNVAGFNQAGLIYSKEITVKYSTSKKSCEENEGKPQNTPKVDAEPPSEDVPQEAEGNPQPLEGVLGLKDMDLNAFRPTVLWLCRAMAAFPRGSEHPGFTTVTAFSPP